MSEDPHTTRIERRWLNTPSILRTPSFSCHMSVLLLGLLVSIRQVA